VVEAGVEVVGIGGEGHLEQDGRRRRVSGGVVAGADGRQRQAPPRGRARQAQAARAVATSPAGSAAAVEVTPGGDSSVLQICTDAHSLLPRRREARAVTTVPPVFASEAMRNRYPARGAAE
jgi:hypothetical protein